MERPKSTENIHFDFTKRNNPRTYAMFTHTIGCGLFFCIEPFWKIENAIAVNFMLFAASFNSFYFSPLCSMHRHGIYSFFIEITRRKKLCFFLCRSSVVTVQPLLIVLISCVVCCTYDHKMHSLCFTLNWYSFSFQTVVMSNCAEIRVHICKLFYQRANRHLPFKSISIGRFCTN